MPPRELLTDLLTNGGGGGPPPGLGTKHARVRGPEPFGWLGPTTPTLLYRTSTSNGELMLPRVNVRLAPPFSLIVT